MNEKITAHRLTNLIKVIDEDDEETLLNINKIILVRKSWNNQIEIVLSDSLKLEVQESIEEIEEKVRDTFIFKLEKE